MTATANRRWLLRRRPEGRVSRDDLELASSPAPLPAGGEVLVRVKLLCMDPTIRNFMDADAGYGVPIALGGAIRGMIVGEVVESRDLAHAVGDLVWGFGEWSDYVAGPAGQFFALPTRFGQPLPAYTHALGSIGLTAHYGLHGVARIQPGDTVLVSGAAGAVGSLVGQMARIAGASRVVGIAGGTDKCRRATERYGYDLCIDYKGEGLLDAALGEAFPDGIDVVFENVGGEILETALNHLRKNARVALCGMIARYGAKEPQPGPRNLWNLVVNTARMQGFLVTDILRDRVRTDEALAEIDDWIRDGRLRYDIDVRTGFENIPDIFNCLFTGAHTGRLVVQID
jgi:NADPH-dependent curcumin reductase CurA